MILSQKEENELAAYRAASSRDKVDMRWRTWWLPKPEGWSDLSYNRLLLTRMHIACPEASMQAKANRCKIPLGFATTWLFPFRQPPDFRDAWDWKQR
jgi:hypothetical protein